MHFSLHDCLHFFLFFSRRHLLAPWQNGVIIDRFDKTIFQKKSKRYKKIQFSTLKGCPLLPEKICCDHKFAEASSKVHEVIVHFLPDLFKSGNDADHFFSRALSTALANHSSPRPSIDERHMSSARSGGPGRRGARSCLLRCPSLAHGVHIVVLLFVRWLLSRQQRDRPSHLRPHPRA